MKVVDQRDNVLDNVNKMSGSAGFCAIYAFPDTGIDVEKIQFTFSSNVICTFHDFYFYIWHTGVQYVISCIFHLAMNVTKNS